MGKVRDVSMFYEHERVILTLGQKRPAQYLSMGHLVALHTIKLYGSFRCCIAPFSLQRIGTGCYNIL